MWSYRLLTTFITTSSLVNTGSKELALTWIRNSATMSWSQMEECVDGRLHVCMFVEDSLRFCFCLSENYKFCIFKARFRVMLHESNTQHPLHFGGWLLSICSRFVGEWATECTFDIVKPGRGRWRREECWACSLRLFFLQYFGFVHVIFFMKFLVVFRVITVGNAEINTPTKVVCFHPLKPQCYGSNTKKVL